MRMEFEIPLPWDVLDIATQDHMKGYAFGFVEFTHEIVYPGLSKFILFQKDLGELGIVSLKKRGERITMIEWPYVLHEKEDHLNRVLMAYIDRLVRDVSLWKANNSTPPEYLLKWVNISDWQGIIYQDIVKNTQIDDRPSNDAFLDDWFKWRAEGGDVTLKEIAGIKNMSYSTVRKKHQAFIAKPAGSEQAGTKRNKNGTK
jgi:hypothetical protein